MPNGDLHINFQKAEVADTVRTVFRARTKVLNNPIGMSCARQSPDCWSWQCTFILDLRKQTNVASTLVPLMSLPVCKGEAFPDYH